MEELKRALKTYFTFTESIFKLWSSIPKRVKNPINSLSNLSEQLEAFSSSEDIGGIEDFLNLKDTVTFKIFISLENHLKIIVQIADEVKVSTEKLNELLSLVEVAQSGVPLSEFAAVDDLQQIRIARLIEWAYNCRQYYQAMCSEMSLALALLNFRDRASVSSLKEAFVEDDRLKKHILYIMATSSIFRQNVS